MVVHYLLEILIIKEDDRKLPGPLTSDDLEIRIFFPSLATTLQLPRESPVSEPGTISQSETPTITGIECEAEVDLSTWG